MNRALKVARSLLVAALLPGVMAAARPGDATRRSPAHPGAATHAARSVSQPAGLPSGLVLGAITPDLAAFDKAVRHQAALRTLFLRWGSMIIPRDPIVGADKLGAQVVIELQPVHLPMTQIASGEDDPWLQQVFAPDLAAIGRSVTLSFAPEMNGQWYSWGTKRTKPADYVLAWRHIHNVLAATSAGRLITWLWQPSAMHFSTPSPRPWWPGSQYVDEIGLDGYYVNPGDTFDVIFARTIKLMRSVTTRPILIGETAVGPSTGHQAAAIMNLFAGVRGYHLRGLVWFDISQHAGKFHQDWRLEDNPRALRAFIAELAATK